MMQASVDSYKGRSVVYVAGSGGQYWLSKPMGRIQGTKDGTGPKYHNVPR